MIVPDLGSLLISLSSVFTLAVKLVFAGLCVFGVWVFVSGLITAYSLVSGGSKFSNRGTSIYGVFGMIVLGSALTVAPVIVWQAASSADIGTGITYSIFNYSNDQSSGHCEQIHSSITYLLMAVGATAWAFAAVVLYDAFRGTRQNSRSALAFFAGGLAAFFINDLGQIVSNTIGMDVSFSNICTSIG